MSTTDPSEYFDAREFALRGDIESTHYWHLHRREVVLRELGAILPPGGDDKLVEIGCGLGTVATHLNDAGYHVDYVDVFEEALHFAELRAKERLGARAESRRFLRADATQDFPVSDVDGVFLLDVIEHLPDDVEVLARARRALRPAVDGAGEGAGPGFVLVTVPAFSFLWSPWDDMEKHKRRYTKATLERALRAAGLEPIRTTYFFLPLFFAALGVKGLRTARALVSRGAQTAATDIRDMAETKNTPLLNRIALAVMAPERAWLRSGTLPLGTSLLTIARPSRGA